MGDVIRQHSEFFAQHPLYAALVVAALTLMPLLELRASIPVGILVLKMNPWAVLLLAVASNILLGPVFYWLLDRCLTFACRADVVRRFWERRVLKLQGKIKPLVDRYGVWGLGLFIGVPLPGSGVYSGAMGGYVLGFTRREFFLATILGVLIAATAVQVIVLTGSKAAWAIKAM